MPGPGIDYGLGSVNIDRETGIRFGVIAQADVMQAWADSAEPDYGEPTCPECGAEGIVPLTELSDDIDADAFEQWREYDCADYACEHCRLTFDSENVFCEEAIGWNYEGDGYEATDCLDGDIMILKSPFYTLAMFCSPCVPGAGNLNSASDDGVESYCFGHDWFEDGVAPYPVYSVETGELVAPDKAA